MTALERKKQTELYLQKLRIPFIDHLPTIGEDEDIIVRDPKEIAKRILVLIYFNYIIEYENRKNEIIQFLKDDGLWDSVSDKEKAIALQESITQKDNVNISWRTEAVWLMLWALNKVESLDLPVEECNVERIMDLFPGYLNPSATFVNTAAIRPKAEILDMADLVYRLHWAARNAMLQGEEIAANLHHGIVYERHYAINWITCFNEEEWDDVSTGT